MTQPVPFPDRKAGFARLRQLAQRPDGDKITPLFAADPKRAERYSASFQDLTLDYSKTSIDDTALDALFALAETAKLEDFRRRLFAGEPVNQTEHRAAMHMALRAPADSGLKAIMPRGTEDAARIAAAERDKMKAFVTAVHMGEIRGATGETFTDVLTIGIGGSDLGPRVATEALTIGRTDQRLNAHFISNVDGHGFQDVTNGLDPARTVVLVASKTFTTLETSMNAAAARTWVTGKLGDAAVASHFAALSTNMPAVKAFGMNPERVFAFQDWVGGRYSLWSPVGLVIPMTVGWEKFQQMLDGAWAMDQHFRDTPLRQNLPVLLGLAGIWNTNALGCGSLCILAYDDRLRRLPAHLQQVEMESNGKHVILAGASTEWDTCPVLFGEPGTNAQHSFMQLVHQGTRKVPVDFILAANADHNRPEAHRALAANAFAQAEALMLGRQQGAIRAEMKAKGVSDAEIDTIAPHRVAVGERPSNTILFDRLTPFALGRLIALYEHKVAVQGCLWGIDSFDQWGVELGKQLATGILPELSPGAEAGLHDGSTTGLIGRFKALRGEN
ncbi:MAG TPA: glucose-6-phosphate isomerase [Rhodopila sp.]|uniref:glucose-6-phosphate isomerase n=1 Tax=Rhodopila sp. TaxID=2480087 RepID=UPI002C4CC9A2|nr:glucose-6-phosphate isomerase [Rhodopila sp.]HVY15958.1 glucose-6-phosphate isomerase [Rhodopila sp.]